VALSKGLVDLGFTMTLGQKYSSDLCCRTLYTDELILAVRPDHPFASYDVVGIRQLEGEPVVTMTREASSPVLTWLERSCHKHGFELRIVRMVSDIETLLLMIEAGMGVAILSRRMVEFYPSYQLKCIPIEDPAPGLDFIAIWPEKSNNPLVSLFIKTLPEG